MLKSFTNSQEQLKPFDGVMKKSKVRAKSPGGCQTALTVDKKSNSLLIAELEAVRKVNADI
jgi:hypothetical protein